MMKNHLTIAGHFVQRHMYDKLRQTFYRLLRPLMQTLLSGTAQVVPNSPKYYHMRTMHRLPANRSLEHIAMNAFRRYPKTVQSNQYICVMIGRYYKQKRAVATSGTSAMHVANLSMAHWPIPYGMQTYLITDSETQIVSKSFGNSVRTTRNQTPRNYSV